MKYIDALNEIQYQEAMRAKNIDYRVNNLVVAKIEEALKKQIPRNPRIELYKGYGKDFVIYYFCPVCEKKLICRDQHGFFGGKQSAFCEDCGQALDWNKAVQEVFGNGDTK
jgi:hypothetical protein